MMTAEEHEADLNKAFGLLELPLKTKIDKARMLGLHHYQLANYYYDIAQKLRQQQEQTPPA